MFSNIYDGVAEQFYLKEDLFHTKIAFIIGLCLCLVFVRNDYLFYGLGSPFYQVVLARVAFVAVTLSALFGLRRITDHRQHERLVYVWGSLAVLLVTFINITRPADNINFVYFDTLVVLVIPVYFPGNLWGKTLLASSLACSDLAVLLLIKTSQYSWQVIGFSYLVALLLGVVIADKFRQLRYTQYYALAKEQGLRLELEKVAYTDPLTGALNRRKFFELGENRYNLFKNTGATFSIIMLDLDSFKNLNDNFGHAAGDVFLKGFAKTIADHKRSGDILGRLGGEEFALLLPGTKLTAALDIAERLRRLCESSEAFFNKRVLQATVSVGVTEAWPQDASFQEVLKRADEALYQAKRKGRNRVQTV